MPEAEHTGAPERLVFMGTPDFAATGLQALLDAGVRPVAVYTQPDRPAGRGRKPRLSAVKALAEANGLTVCQPATLASPDEHARLQALAPDAIIVIAYGQILPPAVLQIPPLGCINVHASLLPRWRGAAPIQRAIEAGDKESGVCLMQMEPGLDTGPVLASVRCTLGPEMTGGELHDQLAKLGSQLLVAELPHLASLLAHPKMQDETRATYAAKLRKAEARLDLAEPAAVLERRIRAFNPWPVCWVNMNGSPFRIWSASVVGAAGHRPGKLHWQSAQELWLGTGTGWLALNQVQPASKKPMVAQDWLNGLSTAQRHQLEFC